MSQLFVVSSRQRALTDWGLTPYAAIAGALGAVTLPRDPPVQWVGPPRVTRRAVLGAGFDTYVAAVLAWPDPPPGGRPQRAADLQRVFGPRIRAALDAAGDGWDDVTVAPYLDATHGPDLAWWASGQAAQTRTRDAYPTLGGRVDPDENPVGPDARAVRPSTPGEAAASLATQAGRALGDGARAAAGGVGLLVGVVALVAGAYYLAPPIAQGLALRLAEPQRRRGRPNPHPPAWDVLPPNTDYGCDARARRRLGARVPGRDGGTITGCATPKGPKGRRAHLVGRWRLGLPGLGALIDKDTAARRIRTADTPVIAADRAGATEWAAYWTRASEDARLPAPLPALDFPHRAGTARTDPDHPLWRDWLRLETARRAGRLSDGDFWEEVRAHPLAPAWYAANEQAARAILAREAARTGRRDTGGAQTRARARALATARGEDVTAAEYRDALRRLR